MMVDGENKTIGALMHEDIDTMTHQLNETGLSNKRADRILVDVNHRMDERGDIR